MKLHFVETPHNSIRVWLYDNIDIQVIRKSKEFQMFELLSIWGGFDKQERNGDEWMHSWELPLTLGKWTDEKFAFYPDCTIQIHGVPIKV